MRVAITGATGFVGGHLTNRLTGEGHEVVCTARRAHDDTVVQRCEQRSSIDASSDKRSR